MNTSVLGQIDPAYDEPQLVPEPLADESTELEPGSTIQGKYTVLGVLGHGGFAVVYDAKHDGLGRGVAIKVLHLRHDTPLALVERFRREARISALVRHPHVLEVYDTGSLPDGSPFLVMERVNGENLAAQIRRGPLPIATTIEITRQLLLGLCAIEEQGIVHRDVKPDNLMLHDGGDGTTVVKLVDFGISRRVAIEPEARLTCHGALVGTPQYMSPEQIRGEEVDIRTDLYATGAVMYEALTGHAPHESSSFSELVVSVLNGQVQAVRARRANCPAELEHIILKLLSRAPGDRYSSPREVLDALDELVDELELPRGADAFRAKDREPTYALTPARTSIVSMRKLRSTMGKPMQLALVAFILSTPGQVVQLHGANAEAGEVSSTEGTMSASGTAAVDALVERVAKVPMAVHALPPAHVDDADKTNTDEVVATTEPQHVSPKPAARIAPVAIPTSATKVTATLTAVEPQASAPRAVEPVEAESPQAAPAPLPPPATAAAAPVEADSHPLVVALDPAQRERFDATMRLALAALVHGRLESAKASYADAIKLAPREPGAYRGYGLVAARLGANQEARVALKRYLALSPGALDAMTIRERIARLR